MALSQALSTGITGLMTHQKAMDNIGNNLANVNTVGFKKGAFQFSTLLEQSLRGGMGADAGTGRGSVNPIALGMGTQTASINKVFTQGDLENTANPNDMAIDGNGFFVLKVGTGYAYTRAGSFYVGEDGSLMAGDGLFVQGTLAVKNADGSYEIPQDARMQNLMIPIGTTGGQSQTSKVMFTGNLDSRQKVSAGTNLFGGDTYPTVASLQKWMNPDLTRSGDPDINRKSDTSWNALQEGQRTFAVSQATLVAASVAESALPPNVKAYNNQTIVTMDDGDTWPDWYYDTTTGTFVNNVNPTTGARILNSAAIIAAGGLPLVEEVKVINGGNVQTSAAYGIQVPEPLPRGGGIANDLTYPEWFYEATGAIPNQTYADIINTLNAMEAGTLAPTIPPGPAGETHEQAAVRLIWPAGINGEQTGYIPRKDEVYAASLTTPLEHVSYLKGNSWVQPFANASNGDEINVTFKKGKTPYEVTFIYNKPVGQDPFNGQVSMDREKSYTLEHFLKFLAGDVDEPTVACQDISPAMFGAIVQLPDFPYGNPATMTTDERTAYEVALANVNLAKSDGNMDDIGGAMGLLSIPPQISGANNGTDAYDVPPESAGAYTRNGSGDVNAYRRYNPATDDWNYTYTGDSFRASFVSNLGAENALSDIRVTFNNVPHETMYSAETTYNAPQGGSSTATVEFYDSLGNPKTATVRMAMVSQDNDFTTWRWYADCVNDTDFKWQADDSGNLNTNLNVGTGLIRFDKNGNYVSGAEYSESQGITINQSSQGVNEPIWIQVLNGLSGTQDLDFSDMTCSATSNGFKLAEQNGRPPGTLDDYTVSLDGVITGVYSNGNTQVLGRLGLAMIPNMNGMIAAGGNLYYTGPASGDARYGHANSGGAGSIKQNMLESSNVDLSIEFTKLISTERGFQANSRTITTADEMIQELLNLKR